MSSACIAYTNLADTVVSLVASSSSLLLPVSNIQNPHIARKWRGTSGTTDSFVLDFGAPISLDTFAAMGITGTQIEFRASLIDTTGIAGEVYDSGVVAVDQNYLSSIVLLPSVVSARYVRVDIITTGSYVELGRLFIGAKTQFSYNYVKGWHRSWNDRSIKTKTRGGQTQVWADNVFRSIDVSFDFLTQTDRDGFVETIDRVNATRTDVLFVTNPASSNLSRDSVFGLISSLTPVVQPYIGTYSKQYMIEERL
jgi:hypothetical protein